MSATGPGLSMVVLLVLPLVYAAPISLTCAELSARYPMEGGYYRWVRMAFGDLTGLRGGMARLDLHVRHQRCLRRALRQLPPLLHPRSLALGSPRCRCLARVVRGGPQLPGYQPGGMGLGSVHHPHLHSLPGDDRLGPLAMELQPLRALRPSGQDHRGGPLRRLPDRDVALRWLREADRERGRGGEPEAGLSPRPRHRGAPLRAQLHPAHPGRAGRERRLEGVGRIALRGRGGGHRRPGPGRGHGRGRPRVQRGHPDRHHPRPVASPRGARSGRLLSPRVPEGPPPLRDPGGLPPRDRSRAHRHVPLSLQAARGALLPRAVALVSPDLRGALPTAFAHAR